VGLSWNAVSGATSYEVLRGSSCGSASVLATGIAVTNYTDATAAPSTTYDYAVRASNTCGAGTASACVVSGILPPQPASALTASDAQNCRVRLNWSPSPTAAVSEYVVYHDAGTGSVDYGFPIANVTSGQISFTFDRGVYGNCGTQISLIKDDGSYANRAKFRLINANQTDYQLASFAVGWSTASPEIFVSEIKVGGVAVFTAPGGTPSNALETLPITPTTLMTGASVYVEIAFQLTAGGYPDVTGYNLTLQPAGGGYNERLALELLASGQRPQPCRSSNVASLLPNIDYVFAVRAVDGCGYDDGGTSLTVGAPSCQPSLTARIVNANAGQGIFGDKITVTAELLAGKIAQAKELLFQYRSSGSGSWLDIIPATPVLHPNPAPAYPFFVHWDTGSLPVGEYQLRAVASDLDGALDIAPQFITVAKTAAGTSLYGYVDGITGEDRLLDPVTYTGGCDSYLGENLFTGLDWVKVPTGAVSPDTRLTCTMENAADLYSLVPSGWQPSGVFRTFGLESGQTTLSGAAQAQVHLPYQDTDNNGVVDTGTAQARNMRLFAYDADTTTWGRLNSQTDLRTHELCGLTPHFSLFSPLEEPWSSGDLVAPKPVTTIFINKTAPGSLRDVTMTITPVTQDIGNNPEVIRYYYVFRGTTASFTPDRAGFTNLSAITTTPSYVYGLLEMESGTTYYYLVTAIDEGGNLSDP
jgi:hypothetical protein